MTQPILLTSFDVWLPHQVTNASDDLLGELWARNQLPPQAQLIRQLPVHFEQAPQQVMAMIAQCHPQLIVCCGMAEARSQLTLEQFGRMPDETLKTTVDLAKLLNRTQSVAISEDAGTFVCNHLYYSVLKYIQMQQSNQQCIFVHVPILHADILEQVVSDFSQILQNLEAETSSELATKITSL